MRLRRRLRCDGTVKQPLGRLPNVSPRSALRHYRKSVSKNAVLPGCAPAEHSVELDASFAGELEGFAKFRIAHSSGKIDEWLAGHVRCFVKVINRFLLCIGPLSAV